MSSSAPQTTPRAEPIRILFVCLGNICRSPTAEAVMQHLLSANDLEDVIEVDSAGTGGWHVGDPADDRARAEAARRGIQMNSAARQVHVGDFEYFDLIVAMDDSNLAALGDVAADEDHREKVHLLREFDPEAGDDLEVPDPYYGGPNGFTDVFDVVEASCRGLLEHIRATYL